MSPSTRPHLLSLALLAAGGAWAAPAIFAQPWLAFAAIFVWGGVFVGIYTVMLVAVGSVGVVGTLVAAIVET